jgi:predicted SnoaL-like aldol condensation-catalyzing enzyme
MMKRIVAAALLATIVAGCNPQDQDSSTETPAADPGSRLVQTISRSLSAEESSNLQIALGQLPQGATLSHVVAEGPSVALHYAAQSEVGSVVGVQFVVFDANHEVVENNRVELPGNPIPHLTGATAEGPVATDTAVEVANKQTVLAFFDALNRGQINAAASRLSDDVTEHTGAGAVGKPAWISSTEAEPARQYGIQRIAAWNDIVMTYQSVGTSTLEGVRWASGWDIFRLRDGKIIERWRLNY